LQNTKFKLSKSFTNPNKKMLIRFYNFIIKFYVNKHTHTHTNIIQESASELDGACCILNGLDFIFSRIFIFLSSSTRERVFDNIIY
jgi:hypothetical protein